MSILLTKSLLSLLMVGVTILLMWSMFEVLGKGEKNPARIKKLKRVHRIAGIFYVAIYLFVSFFCIHYIVASRTELSPRGNIHALLAIVALLLFSLKISFTRIYRKFYPRVQYIGLIMALVTFAMVSTSGGYFLMVTGFGKDRTFEKIYEFRMSGPEKPEGAGLEAGGAGDNPDPEAAMRGEALFKANCSICHDPESNRTIVGPGLSGVLKNPKLPVSGRPATPENVRRQLKTPFKNMPNFSHLTDSQVGDIIAYLGTL